MSQENRADDASPSNSEELGDVADIAESTDDKGTFDESNPNYLDAKQTKLFDTIDKLRELDVNRELDLPQLVVCGIQSSGKSSVLEAITRIAFPRNKELCTKFVTE